MIDTGGGGFSGSSGSSLSNQSSQSQTGGGIDFGAYYGSSGGASVNPYSPYVKGVAVVGVVVLGVMYLKGRK